MTLLLDTHAFLWFVNGDAKLSGPARRLIEDTVNRRLLSIASLWEIAIKVSIKKLQTNQAFPDAVQIQMSNNLIDLLDIQLPHLAFVAQLPLHHRDPFDRLLISQALAQRIPIVSCDVVFDQYGVARLW